MFLGCFPKMLLKGKFLARPEHAVTVSLDLAEGPSGPADGPFGLGCGSWPGGHAPGGGCGLSPAALPLPEQALTSAP